MIEKTKQHTFNMATTRQSSFKPALLALAITQTLLLAAPADALAADTANSEIEVTGRSTAGAATSYTANASSIATGMSMSLKETPQSVSVVTQQRIQDQGLQTLDDLMLNSTGITMQQNDNSSRVTYRARGFSITNYKIDGLTSNYLNSSGSSGAITNLDLYDHVDIIRGANGLLGGTGDPSATINFVRKAPQKKMGAQVGLQYGRWNKRHGFVDVNAPLAFDGRLRSRFVISGTDSGSYMDRAGNKSVDALASFSLDLTSSTVINAGLQYDDSHISGASWGTNVPIWYADGSLTHLPRSTNPVPNWAFTDNHNITVFASIEQYLAPGWKTKLSYSHNKIRSNYAHSTVKANNQSKIIYAGFWNQDGTGGYLNGIYGDADGKYDSLEWTVNGVFHLFGRTHEIMGGVNGSRADTFSYKFTPANCSIPGYAPYNGCQYRANSIQIANWKTWDGSGIPAFNAWRTNARSQAITTNYGGYLAGRFNIIDPLNVVLGMRLSNYKAEQFSYAADNKKTQGRTTATNGVVTPYAGIIFNLNENHSLYASYTSVFSPQTSRDEDGNFIKPITGESYEGGLKSEFFAGGLNTSAVIFGARQKNLAQAIKGVYVKGTSSEQAYSASGKGITSHGIELDAEGKITDNWNVYLGYTYLKVNNPDDSAELTDPHHVFRVFTTWQLPGALHGLTIGGGARMQSYTTYEAFPGRPVKLTYPQLYDVNKKLNISGYALFDLMARYRFNDNVTLGVTVNNLFDKTYYRQRGFYDGQIFGAPRSYWATLNVTY